jgi:glutathione S-transferase
MLMLRAGCDSGPAMLQLIIGNKNYSSWSFRPWLAAGADRRRHPGWESLAILEYLAEIFPAAGLWPLDPAARAHARAIACEMHAGFQAVRGQLPMNVWRPVIKRELDADAIADVARIDTIWNGCRSRVAGAEPFLYGAFSAADAMYAPMVWRFHTYAVEVSEVAHDYMRALMALPAWGEWRRAARRELWVLPHDEVDWPEVKRE